MVEQREPPPPPSSRWLPAPTGPKSNQANLENSAAKGTLRSKLGAVIKPVFGFLFERQPVVEERPYYDQDWRYQHTSKLMDELHIDHPRGPRHAP